MPPVAPCSNKEDAWCQHCRLSGARQHRSRRRNLCRTVAAGESCSAPPSRVGSPPSLLRGMIVDAPAPTQPTLGEIQIFAFDFAPTGFAACQGQLLAIAPNQALFSLIGPRYG
ncbi:MAG: tail fiber protein, partial [Xanthobacteraceae bacterium]